MGCNPGEAMYDKKGNGSKLLPSPKFYLEVIQYTSNRGADSHFSCQIPDIYLKAACPISRTYLEYI